MSQRTLGDFDGGTEPERTGTTRFRRALQLAPDNAEPLDNLSCPFCFGPKSDFNIRENNGSRQVSCGHCTAVIPVEADWYLRGNKVCY